MLTTKKWVALALVLGFATLGVVLLVGCRPSGPRALLAGARLVREGRYGQAVEKLKVATQLLPQNAAAWNYLGLAYHGARQFDLAAPAYKHAQDCDRNLAAARFNLGCLYAEQNNLAAAIPELTTYTILQPQAVDGWLQLGLAQLRARQFTDAQNSFIHVRQLDPGNVQALNDLGLIQLQRNRTREAYAYFYAALQQEPRYAPALFNTAIVLGRYLKRHDLALEKFREYLEVMPRAANRTEVEQIVRQLTSELHPPQPQRAGPTTAVTPTAPPAGAPPYAATAPAPPQTNRLVTASQTGKPAPEPPANPVKTQRPTEPEPPPPAPPQKTAAAESKATLPVEVVHLPEEPPTRPPTDTEPRVKSPSTTAAETTALPAAPADAFNPPSRVVPVPERPGFFERLNPTRWFRRKPESGSASSVSKPAGSRPPSATRTAAPAPAGSSAPAAPATPAPRPEPARYVYRSPTRPVAGQHTEAQPYLVRGAEAQRDGRLAAALAAYRKAVELDPAFFEAQYNLGLAAYELGESALSLSAYEMALAIKPDSAEARYNFALALQQAKYPRDAANELEKLLAGHPDEVRAHLTLANLYAQQLGESRRARTHYLRVLALDPEHPQATAIRYWLAGNPP